MATKHDVFTGLVRDQRTFPRALTPEEVRAIYRNPCIEFDGDQMVLLDTSGNGHHGTKVGFEEPKDPD